MDKGLQGALKKKSKNYKKNNYKNIPVDKWITPREVFSGIVCKQNI
ncbi:hypothetical protein G797_04680 [Escherichia coli HVH 139 (4-3192644)]|nr:hypothetical protein G797_04680 [Escherichia coli HVH 139 (4-3192644)]